MAAPDDSDSAGITRDAAMAMLEPVAGLLLSRQVRFAQAEDLLKMAYLVACARAYVAKGMPANVSALSVATGIRRREVKRLLDEAPNPVALPVSVAAQVLLRWRTDPRFLDARGRPRKLARLGTAGSAGFAELAASVSRDTHPRAVLSDMIRLGTAREADGFVSLVPGDPNGRANRDEAMRVAGANVGDHASAALMNLLSDPPILLERAVVADGLTQASAHRANELAGEIWRDALGKLREQLQGLVEGDAAATNNDWRVRVGMYGYLAPQERPKPPLKRSRTGGDGSSTAGKPAAAKPASAKPAPAKPASAKPAPAKPGSTSRKTTRNTTRRTPGKRTRP